MLTRLISLLPGLWLGLWLHSALAGEVLHANLEHEHDHYLLHLDMRIKGDSTAVFRALLDFNNLTAINDTIVYSKLLERNGREYLVQTDGEGCVWFFCKRVVQVSIVTEMDNGYIMSVTVPEKSDLEYGRTLWQVIDEGDTTRIKYNADYVPAFWIPPIFGPYIFKKRMLEEGQKTVNGIERIVNPHDENGLTGR